MKGISFSNLDPNPEVEGRRDVLLYAGDSVQINYRCELLAAPEGKFIVDIGAIVTAVRVAIRREIRRQYRACAASQATTRSTPMKKEGKGGKGKGGGKRKGC